jgi:transcriptional regulator with XRE-family HTH domain
MTEHFDDLKKRLSPEARKRVDERKDELLDELPLQELRQARELTQRQLADSLGVEQSSVSKMERRTDMYLSTLRSYVEALGGELQVRACFPEGDFVVEQFQNLDSVENRASRKNRTPREA